MLALHPTRGVNPRLTVCRACGADVGVILLGARDYYTKCGPCGLTMVGGGPCPSCGKPGTDRTAIREGEKVPVELCPSCARQQEEVDAEVARGGVLWRCTKCGSAGAVRAQSSLARQVRLQLNRPTGPCGIEFDGRDCPVCEEKRT